MRTTSELELVGSIAFPTSNNRTLRFEQNPETNSARYAFELSVYYRDTANDLPDDVIAFQVWVADREGVVWTATCRFTPHLFTSRMVDFGEGDEPMPFEDASATVKDTFSLRLLLEGVRASSDDRFYRRILLGDRIYTVKFHYTCMTFDVAVFNEGNTPCLAVRLREDSLFFDGAKSVPPLWFPVYPAELWRWNVAIYDSEEEWWVDSSLPIPLVFELTDEQGEPQDGVTAL